MQTTTCSVWYVYAYKSSTNDPYQGTSARLASHSSCRFRPISSSVISPPSALYASKPSGSLTGLGAGDDSRDAVGEVGSAETSEGSAP